MSGFSVPVAQFKPFFVSADFSKLGNSLSCIHFSPMCFFFFLKILTHFDYVLIKGPSTSLKSEEDYFKVSSGLIIFSFSDEDRGPKR